MLATKISMYLIRGFSIFYFPDLFHTLGNVTSLVSWIAEVVPAPLGIPVTRPLDAGPWPPPSFTPSGLG